MQKAYEYRIQQQVIGDVTDQLEEGEAENEADQDDVKLAYLKMSNCKYYSVSATLYVVTVLGAVFIEDVTVIFDVLGGFTITDWMLPGVVYLLL